MKIKKSIIGVCLAIVFAVLLVACNSNEDDTTSETPSDNSNQGVTIDFAIHVANPENQEPAFYSVIEEFQNQNPDIKINLIGKEQQDHISSIKMMAQSDELPDVFWMLPDPAEELYDAGMLMDLNEFLSNNPDIKESIIDSMLESYNKDGEQYGLAYQPLVTGFFYNKEIFSEYGVDKPDSYEDLIEATKIFSENGITTIAKGAKDEYSVWAFLIMLSRYGYFEKIDSILAGEESYNNAEFLAFYEKIEQLRENGAFPDNVTTLSYFQAVEQFLNGDAALLDAGVWEVQKIEQSDIGENVGFWWGPTFSDGVGDQKISSVVPAAPLLVSKKVEEDNEKKEAIYKLFEFYYGEIGTQIMVDNQIPPMTNLTVEVDENKHPLFKEVIDQMSLDGWESQPNQPDLVVPESVANAMYDSIYGVINGIYTPSEAVQVVDDAISVLN